MVDGPGKRGERLQPTMNAPDETRLAPVNGELPAPTSPLASPALNAPWIKAKAPALTPAISAEDALAAIVVSAVEHLRANEDCVLTRSDVEGVHQMRVAARRLRACLSLFRALIPAEQRDHLACELRWLIGELGPARDADVFTDEVVRPVIKALPKEAALKELRERAEEIRHQGYERAEAALNSQRYLGLVMLLDAWARGRRWRSHDAPDLTVVQRSRASEVADALLERRYRRALALGKGLAKLKPVRRHQLRIQIKKLRYATEFLGRLFPRRKVVPYTDTLKTLQDRLGVANDLTVARGILERVADDAHGKERARLSFAAGLVIGWNSRRGENDELLLMKAWQAFSTRAPFWTIAPKNDPGVATAPTPADDAGEPPAMALPPHQTADA